MDNHDSDKKVEFVYVDENGNIMTEAEVKQKQEQKAKQHHYAKMSPPEDDMPQNNRPKWNWKTGYFPSNSNSGSGNWGCFAAVLLVIALLVALYCYLKLKGINIGLWVFVV